MMVCALACSRFGIGVHAQSALYTHRYLGKLDTAARTMTIRLRDEVGLQQDAGLWTGAGVITAVPFPCLHGDADGDRLPSPGLHAPLVRLCM